MPRLRCRIYPSEGCSFRIAVANDNDPHDRGYLLDRAYDTLRDALIFIASHKTDERFANRRLYVIDAPDCSG